MTVKELVVITFEGKNNRNKVLASLENSNVGDLKFLHILAQKINSETIIFNAPVNNSLLYDKLCKLRTKKVCGLITTKYEKNKNSFWKNWSFKDESYNLTSGITIGVINSIPVLIKIIIMIALM